MNNRYKINLLQMAKFRCCQRMQHPQWTQMHTITINTPLSNTLHTLTPTHNSTKKSILRNTKLLCADTSSKLDAAHSETIALLPMANPNFVLLTM
jgi:hypothetical protein